MLWECFFILQIGPCLETKFCAHKMPEQDGTCFYNFLLENKYLTISSKIVPILSQASCSEDV
jgi:hypothetical protein